MRMKIDFLEYYAGSYKTTNPPISEETMLRIERTPDDGITLTKKNTVNAYSRKQQYHVPAASFEQLQRLAEELKLAEHIRGQMNQPAPPDFMPGMTGGNTSESFTMTVNGTALRCTQCTEPVSLFLRSMREIVSACGEPFDETETGTRPTAGAAFGAPGCFYSQTPPAPSYHASAAQQPTTEVGEGGWYCPACGNANTGRFCTECGTKKP